MSLGSHNTNCATAAGHVCRCGGCGGSQHGSGWWDLAREPAEVRADRRARYEHALQRDKDPSKLRPTVRNKSLMTDVARVDIADWLAASADPDPADHDRSATIDRATAVASGLTKATWQDIAAELDTSRDARQVRRDLANHGWCDLIVGLIRAIETFHKVLAAPLRAVPDAAAGIVKDAMLGSDMQAGRDHLGEAAVDVIVDRVWRAFTLTLGLESLAGITGAEMLRCLRILAVFICPAPEKHPAVRRHALRPLGDDVHQILTKQTKDRLGQLFSEWQSPSPGVS